LQIGIEHTDIRTPCDGQAIDHGAGEAAAIDVAMQQTHALIDASVGFNDEISPVVTVVHEDCLPGGIRQRGFKCRQERADAALLIKRRDYERQFWVAHLSAAFLTFVDRVTFANPRGSQGSALVASRLSGSRGPALRLKPGSATASHMAHGFRNPVVTYFCK